MTSVPDQCELLCLDLPKAESVRKRLALLDVAGTAGGARALCANARLGWWWAGPAAALAIGAVAARESLRSWRDEDRPCCAPLVLDEAPVVAAGCTDACCQPTAPR
jgi:hypothetical protein